MGVGPGRDALASRPGSSWLTRSGAALATLAQDGELGPAS